MAGQSIERREILRILTLAGICAKRVNHLRPAISLQTATEQSKVDSKIKPINSRGQSSSHAGVPYKTEERVRYLLDRQLDRLLARLAYTK